MDQSREELTNRIIGLGVKSIRKNYYPELKQRITELEKRLEWQVIQQKILEEGSSCITLKEVYRKFLDNFKKLSWITEDDCIYISYITESMLSSKSVKNSSDPEMKSIMPASEMKIPESNNILRIPLYVEQREISCFHLIPSHGHEIIGCENELISALVRSMLPSLRRILIQYENKLLERQLYNNQKIQALGSLASGIAHDFNNILTSIFGYSELALGTSDPSQQQDYVQNILASAKRAKDLTEQILAFSRVEGIEKEPVPLKKSLSDTVKMIRASIPATISIELDMPDIYSPVVNANPTQLQQVFMNLCTNASHAMSVSGGTLSLALDLIRVGESEITSLPEGSYAHLIIKDSGHGMDADTLLHIFEPYFTTKKRGEGTGLGLSVVYSIMNALGGEIHAYSEPGKGTVFHLYFPVLEEYAVNGVEMPLKEFPTGNEKILLIDDDISILDSMKLMLMSLGYDVDSFNSPADALRAAASYRNKYDLVITDMTMPEFTGIDVARYIHKQDKNIKIILLTGLIESFSDNELIDLGFNKYISKPVLKRDLAKAVRFVLDE